MKTRRDFAKLILLLPLLRFDLKIHKQPDFSTYQKIKDLAVDQNLSCAYFSKGIDLIKILNAQPKFVRPNFFLNDDVNLNLQDMLDQVEQLKLTGTSIQFVIIENQNRPATVIDLDVLESSQKQNSLG